MSDRDEWQPISTAPEETEVLVWAVDSAGWFAVVASLADGQWSDSMNGYRVEPTHWRPLPPPPKGDGE